MKRSLKKKQAAPPAVTSVTAANTNYTDETRSMPEGISLKHFWQNADDPSEVIFLLSTSDLNTAKQFIKKNSQVSKKELLTAPRGFGV